MGNFFPKERHKNDPGWVSGLNKYKGDDEPEAVKASKADVKATERNHTSSPPGEKAGRP